MTDLPVIGLPVEVLVMVSVQVSGQVPTKVGYLGIFSGYQDLAQSLTTQMEAHFYSMNP